tara:strand:+ start:2572 stop:3441 length:870 start_codon:yes stop_codon:yes gene_type:complete
MLGHLAAVTEKIRLGTAVIVPNLHNPIRIAEDSALVDLLSLGRLDVGFGRGTYGYEYGGFGVPAEDSQSRFRETVLAVKNLWCDKGVSIDSPFFSVRNVDLVPSVVQSPHPPIYIAATRSEETLDFMISNQFLLCIAVVQDTDAALALVEKYRSLCHQEGQLDHMDDVPFFRYVHVADTERRALENTKKHVDWIQDIMQWRRNLVDATEVHLPMQKWRNERSESPLDSDYISEKRAFIGTPEAVAEKIMMLKDHGISYFGCNFSMGGISQEEVIRSMKLFEKKVIPLIS